MTTEIIAGRENGVAEKCVVKPAAKVDLIIVGDKGRNTFSLLVGSVTEELLTMIWKYLYGL
jgi:nucleotide-binding universal stress UspA family protein